jgi:hypothetical protein
MLMSSLQIRIDCTYRRKRRPGVACWGVEVAATRRKFAAEPVRGRPASGRAVDLRTIRRQPHQDRNRPKGVAGVAACVDT